MRYCSLKYSQSDNLGDEIQSLAAEQFLPSIDGFVDRDTELHAVAEPSVVILNGWFKHGPSHWRENAADCWPPSPNIYPAFVGFHIAFPDLLSAECVDYYRRWAPIGCRDRGTMDMLQQRGVDAYLSRCLSLTFSRRATAPAAGKVYIVEGKDRLDRRLIPPDIADGAVSRNHYVAAHLKKKNDLKRKLAGDLLREYREQARLVVTNLLHCALPCLAMAIPVVFLSPYRPGDPGSYRLDPIRDLLTVHGPGDAIDWNPSPADVSTVAAELRTGARAAVAGAVARATSGVASREASERGAL